jgi:hypothetical protein
MAQPNMQDFLGLSSELTCFTVFELYGTGQASAYFAAVEKVVSSDLLNAMLAAWRAVQALPAAERKVQLRRQILGDQKLGPVARNMIKLWYSGTWYELPQEWIEVYGATAADVAFVVSPTAYTEGLMWTAFGAHPPGAKAQGYGSWAEPPVFPPFS